MRGFPGNHERHLETLAPATRSAIGEPPSYIGGVSPSLPNSNRVPSLLRTRQQVCSFLVDLGVHTSVLECLRAFEARNAAAPEANDGPDT